MRLPHITSALRTLGNAGARANAEHARDGEAASRAAIADLVARLASRAAPTRSD